MKYIFYSLILLFYCSLYDDYYPSSGVFCDLQVEQGECIQLLLEENKFIYQKEIYPLLRLNRASYQTIIEDKVYSIKMLAEHRIELEYPNGRKQIFHRKKKGKKL